MDRTPKETVEAFLAAFAEADYERAFACTRPDGLWKLWSGQGDPDTTPMAAMRDRLEQVAGLMERPVRWTAVSLTADGDKVFAEIEGEGRTHSGFHYRNNYAVLFSIEDGRIAELSEMCEAEPVEGLMAALAG